MVHSILDGKFTSTYECSEPHKAITGDLIALDEPANLPIGGNQKSDSFTSASISQGGKLRDSFPSRIISISEESVLLEIVVNLEDMTTENRVFNKILFTGYDVQVGKSFTIKVFERANGVIIEIDPDLLMTT